MHQKPQVIAKLSSPPDSPGIYLFYNVEEELIYVGKASSLKQRVKSYFRSLPSASPLWSRLRSRILDSRESGQGGTSLSRPIEEMIHEVARVDWKQTDSALEAIILEANAIKQHQPKYNILGKDDKSWSYLVITKDKFPLVETMREREVKSLKSEVKSPLRYVFGPYPGLNIAAAMKLLRKLFHFSNCLPPPPAPSFRHFGGQTGRRGKQSRPCLYYQMGQCPGICTGEISVPDYKQKVIRPLVMFLRGKKKQVIRLLERHMKIAVKSEQYEEAARLRDQFKALYRIQDVALLNKSFFGETSDVRLQTLDSRLQSPSDQSPKSRDQRPLRIEGYDISNLGGTDKVGSMVVFDETGPVKSAYRKFTIKTVSGQSDVDCLAEVMERRLSHHEWPMPQVILVDGGRPQVNRVKRIVETHTIASVRKIPVVGIAKGPKRRRNDFILGSRSPQFIVWVNNHQRLLIRVRDEAHRFAITFHRARRGKSSLGR